MSDQNETPVAAGGDKKPQFSVQRIYVKDISFEVPGAPQCFNAEWKPEAKVQFNSGAQRLAESLYEVVLNINVETTNGDKVAYIVEVQQAGIFLAEVPEQALEHVLGVQCPSILYAYARETVSDLVMRGTFPQFLLQPMNFDSIFQESKRRQQKAAAAAAETAAKH